MALSTLSRHYRIVRQPGESMRACSNRYRRCEVALQSGAVDVCGVYDSESRSNRLLERSRLSPANQRLLLIGTGYKLAYEAIVESLHMNFPEHKNLPRSCLGKMASRSKQSLHLLHRVPLHLRTPPAPLPIGQREPPQPGSEG